MHVHILHPNGKAVIFIDGKILNDGVPQRVIDEAAPWVNNHISLILEEWAKMGNPEKRWP